MRQNDKSRNGFVFWAPNFLDDVEDDNLVDEIDCNTLDEDEDKYNQEDSIQKWKSLEETNVTYVTDYPEMYVQDNVLTEHAEDKPVSVAHSDPSHPK